MLNNLNSLSLSSWERCSSPRITCADSSGTILTCLHLSCASSTSVAHVDFSFTRTSKTCLNELISHSMMGLAEPRYSTLPLEKLHIMLLWSLSNLVHVSLKGFPSFHYINCTGQLCVICSLAEWYSHNVRGKVMNKMYDTEVYMQKKKLRDESERFIVSHRKSSFKVCPSFKVCKTTEYLYRTFMFT